MFYFMFSCFIEAFYFVFLCFDSREMMHVSVQRTCRAAAEWTQLIVAAEPCTCVTQSQCCFRRCRTWHIVVLRWLRSIKSSTSQLCFRSYFTCLMRDAMPARYMLWPCVSVRLSACLCLSQVSVLLKRLNVELRKQRLTIAQEIYLLNRLTFAEIFGIIDAKFANFYGGHPQQGRQTQVWWAIVSEFRQINRYISKTVQSR